MFAMTLLLVIQTSPVPVLTFSEGTPTTVAVTWRTSADTSGPVKWSGGMAQPTTQPLKLGDKTWHYHTARLGNLQLGREYTYTLPEGSQHKFRTPNPQNGVRILYFGDVQNSIGPKLMAAAVDAAKRFPSPDAMIFAGDLIDSPHNDGQWQEFFTAGRDLFATIPTIATAGNHEHGRLPGAPNDAPRQTSLQWRPSFEFPLNGPMGLGLSELTYYVDLGELRIVSLNSNAKIEEQAKWFDDLMTRSPKPWTLVTYHHPVFSTAMGRDNPKVRELWAPLFTKHGVAMALQGHDHTYGRRSIKAASGGETVFVVSVVGSKMYKLSEDAKAQSEKFAENTSTFQTLTLRGNRLAYTTYIVGGEVFDQITLERGRDGVIRRVAP